jgi:hypothetical protein
MLSNVYIKLHFMFWGMEVNGTSSMYWPVNKRIISLAQYLHNFRNKWNKFCDALQFDNKTVCWLESHYFLNSMLLTLLEFCCCAGTCYRLLVVNGVKVSILYMMLLPNLCLFSLHNIWVLECGQLVSKSFL